MTSSLTTIWTLEFLCGRGGLSCSHPSAKTISGQCHMLSGGETGLAQSSPAMCKCNIQLTTCSTCSLQKSFSTEEQILAAVVMVSVESREGA